MCLTRGQCSLYCVPTTYKYPILTLLLHCTTMSNQIFRWVNYWTRHRATRCCLMFALSRKSHTLALCVCLWRDAHVSLECCFPHVPHSTKSGREPSMGRGESGWRVSLELYVIENISMEITASLQMTAHMEKVWTKFILQVNFFYNRLQQ